MVDARTAQMQHAADVRDIESSGLATASIPSAFAEAKAGVHPHEVQRRIVVMTALLNDALTERQANEQSFDTADYLAKMRNLDRRIAAARAQKSTMGKQTGELRKEIAELTRIENQLAERVGMDLQNTGLHAALPDKSRDKSRFQQKSSAPADSSKSKGLQALEEW